MRRIRLGRNAVPDSAKDLILEVWKSGQFSPGVKVREFEEKWAKLHGAKHSVFVNSGTDALRLSLLALKEKFKWKDGDQVIVPATTFVATVNVVIQAGLVPFFVDVGMHDYLMNPWNIERLNPGKQARDKIVAVIPVHLFGNHCSREIYQMARDNDWAVIEDSCETILNPTRGIISCHSTYMAHHVTTGVGGFASTNSDELNLLIRSYANHGRNTDYLPGYAKGTDIKKRFLFDRIGYSARGTEFEAALGLAQLPTLKQEVEKRKKVGRSLWSALSMFPELSIADYDELHTFMMFPIVLKRGDKYKLCAFLEEHGIETRDLMPIITQPCYKEIMTCPPDWYQVSFNLAKNGFYIPCHPDMNWQAINYIIHIFRKFLTKI